jgi:acid phosphatase (class A)
VGTLKLPGRRARAILIVAILAIAAGALVDRLNEGPHYLADDTTSFAASFDPPPSPDSPVTRAELDVLLTMQASRTPAQVEAARADRKTEIHRFYAVLGLPPEHSAELREVRGLAERVEDDVRLHVRAVKNRFRRLRPYEIEPRLEPCIADVKGDLSYPSGHAAYAYAMAELLSLMVPERRVELRARADEFAGQRMMCGVHFRSDLEAGRLAARRLMDEIAATPTFATELQRASTELRTVMGLPPLRGEIPAAAVSSVRSRRTASRLRRSSRPWAHVSFRPSAAIPRTCAAARAVPW